MQAGILQGDVADVMVMDIWQASLMRAFAKQQLRETDSAADEMESSTDDDEIEDEDEEDDVLNEVSEPDFDSDDDSDEEIGSADELSAVSREEEEWGPADLESLQIVD